MLFALAAAATAATNWLIAGKVMVAVGTGLVAVSPVIESKSKERR